MNATRWTTGLIIIILSLCLVACGSILEILAEPGELAMVDRVEVTVEQADPPEYYAEVFGQLPDGCTKLDGSEQEVVATTIKVTLYTAKAEKGTCPDLAPVPFGESIQLEVSSLSPGSYAVEVNGVVTSFILE